MGKFPSVEMSTFLQNKRHKYDRSQAEAVSTLRYTFPMSFLISQKWTDSL